MRINKDGTVYFICNGCSKKLRKENPTCLNCGTLDEEAKLYWMEDFATNKKERLKKQSEEFENLFNEGCQRVAFEKLREVKQFTVKELVAALNLDGFFEKIIENAKSTGRFRDFNSPHQKWQWMYARSMGLAKWWLRKDAVFIGVLIRKGVQGHPYLIYLPGQIPDDVVEIRNKADWSVKKTMKYDKSRISEELEKIKKEMKL